MRLACLEGLTLLVGTLLWVSALHGWLPDTLCNRLAWLRVSRLFLRHVGGNTLWRVHIDVDSRWFGRLVVKSRRRNHEFLIIGEVDFSIESCQINLHLKLRLDGLLFLLFKLGIWTLTISRMSSNFVDWARSEISSQLLGFVWHIGAPVSLGEIVLKHLASLVSAVATYASLATFGLIELLSLVNRLEWISWHHDPIFQKLFVNVVRVFLVRETQLVF